MSFTQKTLYNIFNITVFTKHQLSVFWKTHAVEYELADYSKNKKQNLL